MDWKFLDNQKKHTQDGPQLVALMKSVGHGKRPVLALDVGCGDGIIAFEALRLEKVTWILAFDKQAEAIRACEENLASYIQSEKAAVRHLSAQRMFSDKSSWDKFDRMIINPPFFSSSSGVLSLRREDRISRFDSTLKLKVWANGARKILKTGGELYSVFPTERMSELFNELSRNGVEPKEVWWLKADKRRRRFFLRAVRNSKPGIIFHFDA